MDFDAGLMRKGRWVTDAAPVGAGWVGCALSRPGLASFAARCRPIRGWLVARLDLASDWLPAKASSTGFDGGDPEVAHHSHVLMLEDVAVIQVKPGMLCEGNLHADGFSRQD